MACLPLIERELRVALRKQRPAWRRLKVAALAVGGAMLACSPRPFTWQNPISSPAPGRPGGGSA